MLPSEMSSKRKLTTLSYADKLKAIEAVKSGLKRKDVAVQFGIHESTLSVIIKKEAEFLKKRESGESLFAKRRNMTKYPILEQCLYTWFEQCRNENISVNGPKVKEKAQEFANSLKIHDFRASNGWLDNFKKRHDLAFKKASRESASVSRSVCQKCKSKNHNLVNDTDYIYLCPCAFPSESQEIIEEEDKETLKKRNKHMSNKTLEDFVTCDDEVATAGMIKQEEILESVSDGTESDKEDDFNDDPLAPSSGVSIDEARGAIITVRSFIEQRSSIKIMRSHKKAK